MPPHLPTVVLVPTPPSSCAPSAPASGAPTPLPTDELCGGSSLAAVLVDDLARREARRADAARAVHAARAHFESSQLKVALAAVDLRAVTEDMKGRVERAQALQAAAALRAAWDGGAAELEQRSDSFDELRRLHGRETDAMLDAIEGEEQRRSERGAAEIARACEELAKARCELRRAEEEAREERGAVEAAVEAAVGAKVHAAAQTTANALVKDAYAAAAAAAAASAAEQTALLQTQATELARAHRMLAGGAMGRLALEVVDAVPPTSGTSA